MPSLILRLTPPQKACISHPPHPTPTSYPGSSLHRHLLITCCVSGKSNIKAQQGFGTAESCSPSSPTTSTKRQLSSTPRHFINWNTQPGKWRKHEDLNWCVNSPMLWDDTAKLSPLALFKDAALWWSNPTTPFKPRHWDQRWEMMLRRQVLLLLVVASYFRTKDFPPHLDRSQYQSNLRMDINFVAMWWPRGVEDIKLASYGKT